MRFILRRTVRPIPALIASVVFVSSAVFDTPEAKAEARDSTFEVCVYEDIDYGGAVGCSYTSRARLPTQWNEVISSVRIKSGTTVEFFADSNFGGESIQLTAGSSNANFVDLEFNDIVSSFRVIVDEDTDGSEGDEGTDGSVGDDGAEGDEGTDGSEGDDGAEGDEGTDGSVGDDGTEGEEGTDGSEGDDGAEGGEGTDGSEGDDGAEGDEGTDGSEGDDVADNGGEDDEGSDGSGDDQLPAPPETIIDAIRPGLPVVTRSFYNDEIAVYFGEGMDPGVDWMNGYIEEVWKYIKQTYGYFGPDNRIYVVAHADPAFNYATINNRFESGFGYRNVIDLGGAWDWSNPERINYEVITHELAHIVEGGNNDTKESPSFQFWGDSKWADIFIYDVYMKLGRTEWAADWFDQMQTSTGGYNDAFAFRDFYYPLYEQFGIEVYDRYFKLLTECFPTKEITVANGATAREHSRRANPGEILYYFSAAAGESVLSQFTTAFGWTNENEAQLSQAQADFGGCADGYQ